MGIFSDIEDYTVDELQEMALELYDRAYRAYAALGTPDQVKLMAEWSAIAEFRRKLNINSHKVAVPSALIPAELLRTQRTLAELQAHAAVRPRGGRLPKPNAQRIVWVQAVQEPVADPIIGVMGDDPFNV